MELGESTGIEEVVEHFQGRRRIYCYLVNKDKILVMRFNNLEGGTRCSRTGEKKIHLSMVAYNVNLVNVIVRLGLERENTK